MKISNKGVKFIVEFEGKLTPIGNGRYKAYRCPAGVWTIYAGVTEGVHQGMIVTEAEGEAMFQRELRKFEVAVERLVKVPLNQNQFDALVSFAYNCGEGALAKSTLLKKLNAGDYKAAALQFAAWNKAKVNGVSTVLRGLTRRRAAESLLFRAPAEVIAPLPPQTDIEPMPQQVDVPKADQHWLIRLMNFIFRTRG